MDAQAAAIDAEMHERWRRLIEQGVREGRLTPEQGAKMWEMAVALSSESTAKTITDPAVWQAARDLLQATTELNDRLYAGQVSGERYQEEMLALLKSADADTMEAAHRIQRASLAALRSGPGTAQA